jgi:hypothetical protein
MDEDEVETLAFGLILELAKIFNRQSEQFSEYEHVQEFINTTERDILAQILREESTDEIASVLNSRSNVAQDVFWKMRELCGGIKMIGTDPEKEAQVRALATILEDATGEATPTIDDLTTTQVVVDEPSVRVATAEMKQWLNEIQPDRFYSIWGSVPTMYEDEIQKLTKHSTDTQLIFGRTVFSLITEELVETDSVVPLFRTVRQWLNAIVMDYPADIYKSTHDVSFSLFVLDEVVIAGYFAREDSPMSAFVRTTDPSVHEWALRVFEASRARSQELKTPILFDGDNPYFGDSTP